MSAPNPIIKSILNPDLKDLLSDLKSDIFYSLNCVKIGQIQSFDLEKKTAEIKILFKKVLLDGTFQSMTALVDCPIVTLQGGGAAIEFPISVGDQCLVFFSDRNINSWYSTGSEAPPPDTRAHNLSDGIALVGVNALTSNLPDYESGVTKLFMGDGKFLIKANEISMIKGSAGISVANDKVKISGPVNDLLTAIEGLIETIKSVSTNPGGGPLNSASIAALEAQKAIFKGFLYS